MKSGPPFLYNKKNGAIHKVRHTRGWGLSGHALRSFTKGGLAIVMFVINNVRCCLRYKTDSIDCQFWGIFQLNSNGNGMRALTCINKMCIMACENSTKLVVKNRSMHNRCGGLYQNDRSFRGGCTGER